MLPTKPQQEEDANKSLVDKAADTAAVGAALSPWLVTHREAVAFPKIKEFLTHLRADPDHKKIGSVGFCWGGRYSVLLTHGDADPYVDAAVAFHPSFLSIPGEIEKIEKPVDIEVGDQDALVSASDIETIRGIFHNKPQCHIEVHPDQVHGFSVRGDLSIEMDKKAKGKGNENVRTQNNCANPRL
jgi:dienelactone hydrolase